MALTRPTRRRKRMGRKTSEQYAELGSHKTLASRMEEKGFGARRLARYCGHDSHTQFVRLKKGHTKTTSVRTAQLIEEALEAKGMLFTVKTVKPLSRTEGRIAA